MAERITIDVEVTGAEAGTQRLNQIGSAVENSGQTVTAAGRKWGELGGAIGNVGSVVGAASPQFARIGGIMGQVGAASTALTGAMGPLGVAIAALTTGFALYRAASERTREEQEAQRQSVERLTRSYGDLLSSIQAASSAAQRDERMARGVGTREEFEARARLFENRAEQLRLALRGDIAGDTLEDRMVRIRTMTAQLRAAEREAERVRQHLARGESEGFVVEEEGSIRGAGGSVPLTDADRGRGGGGGGGRQSSYDQDLARGLQREQAATARWQAEQARLEQERHQAELERIRIETEERQKALDIEIAGIERAEEARRDAHLKRVQEIEREQAEQQAASDKLKADAEGVLSPMVSNLTGAIGELIAGTKSADEAFLGLLASFLEMIAQQTALQAAKEFAEAIASFASQDYGAGAQHLAAGVAFTAVAVAAGAAGAAVSAAAAPAAPANASGGAGAPSGGSGGDNVYNINGTIITSSGSRERAQAGRELGALVSEGAARYGRAG